MAFKDDEERKLILFGWAVTILGNEIDCATDKDKLAKVNKLVDKMYELGAMNPNFLSMEELKKVTRFETIDHTDCPSCKGKGRVTIEGLAQPSMECPACHGSGCLGREVVFFDAKKQLELSVQDNGRTLKVFIKPREKKDA